MSVQIMWVLLSILIGRVIYVGLPIYTFTSRTEVQTVVCSVSLYFYFTTRGHQTVFWCQLSVVEFIPG